MSPIALIAFLFFAALALASVDSSRAQWVPVNGKGGASATCIASSGTNIFVGTNSGILISSDKGLTWSVIDSGLTDSNITALYTSGRTVVAGTFNGVLFRSSDFGVSWQRTGNTSHVYGFTTLGPFLYAVNDNAMVRSGDTGVTWVINDTANRGLYLRAMAGWSTLLFGGHFGGILFSFDLGMSWVTPAANSLADHSIASLAFEGNTLFAGTQYEGSTHDTSGGGIFRSTNQGDSWTCVYSDPTITVSAFLTSGSVIYAGTDKGVLTSNNYGDSWTLCNAGLTNTKVQALYLADGILLAGTQGDGIYRSTDSGQHWSANNVGIAGTDIRQLYTDGADLFAGDVGANNFYNGGIMRSTDRGETWQSINPDSSTSGATTFATIDNLLFAGSFGGEYAGVSISTDHGSSWTTRNKPVSRYDGSFGFCSLGSKIFAASTSVGLFRSTDSGLSWSRVDSAKLRSVRFFSIVTKHDTLFAGSYSGVFRSTDSGTVWQRVNQGMTDTDIFCLAVVGNDIFAADVNYHGVLRSTDDGESWEEVNNGLQNNTFAYTFAVYGTNLFVGVEEGVFLTTNFGDSWVHVSEGFPYLTGTAYVTSLAIDSTYLYANMYANNVSGVWRRPLAEMIPSAESVYMSTKQPELSCYPNPISQTASISFTPPTSGHAEISILNLLGTEVTHLFSGELSPAEHTFQWNPNPSLPDGMYECLIRTDGTAPERLPMMLVR